MSNLNNTLMCLWPYYYTLHQCESVVIYLQVFAGLSLFGCMFVIFIICLFRDYQFFVFRLLFFLSISSALQSISYLISDINNYTTCMFQAITMQYFSWSTLLWVISITIHVLCSTKKKTIENKEKYLHLISWLLPLFWVALPFTKYSYGKAGAWCWIRHDAAAMRFGAWYVPKFVVVFFLITSYSYILLKAVQEKKQWAGVHNNAEQAFDRNTFILKEIKQLAVYPLIYLIVSLPSLIFRIMNAIHPDDAPDYTILILGVISSSANGAVNAVAFALYGGFQKRLTFSQLKLAALSWLKPKTPNVIHNYVLNDFVYTIS
ncbi:cyclic AMP receptor-like protein A [Hydra vulgaris]|uniref:Cyclic AMP receptor-like protein A n=1 Tax=Hydra vulgaris TaxID=6087 RepID=A0ABM4BEF0_HYDVU